MGDPPWKPRRRPHSAGGVPTEPLTHPRPRSVNGKPPSSKPPSNKPPSNKPPSSKPPSSKPPSSKPPSNKPPSSKQSSRSGSVDHEDGPTSELGFTDKLKALRELIASSKSCRHASQGDGEKSSGGRIMVRRQQNAFEAVDVGQHVQFSVNSLERRDSTHGFTKPGGKENAYLDDVHDSELFLSSDGQKYGLPARPRSESYSHLLSRDLQQMSLARERGWVGFQPGDLSPESGSKRVSFRPGCAEGSKRSQSALDYFHHEVPERDWNVPARNSRSSLNSHSENSQRASADGPAFPTRSVAGYMDTHSHTVPTRSVAGYMDTHSHTVPTRSVAGYMDTHSHTVPTRSVAGYMDTHSHTVPTRSVAGHMDTHSHTAPTRSVAGYIDTHSHTVPTRSVAGCIDTHSHTVPTRSVAGYMDTHSHTVPTRSVAGYMDTHSHTGPTRSVAGCIDTHSHTVPTHTAPALMVASDVRAAELLKAKDAIYKQFSPRGSHPGSSPPEHDCPSSASTTPRLVQTNVRISDNPRMKARPRSADHVGRCWEKAVISAVRSSEGEDGHGHWTQLLSQKRDKHDSRSGPGSPATVQNGPHRASPHAFLLQEAARQLQNEHQHVKARKEVHKERDDGAVENVEDGNILEELLQDDEVAKILRQPRTKKKIIIKRGSVKTVHETDSDSQRVLPKKGSSKNAKAETKPVHIKSKLTIRSQSSVDSDDSSDAARDQVLTLDRLKSLLKGRRSESRPNSQTSVASTSSPAPMKAVHYSRHHRSRYENGMSVDNPDAQSHTGDSNQTKPVQRKIIRRPPTQPKEGREKKNNIPSSRKPSKTEESKIGGASKIHKEKASPQRPSSAPHLSSKLTSSSPSSSTKPINTTTRKGQGQGASTTLKPSTGIAKNRERSRSSTDVAKDTDSAASVQSLRSNVQRLHQEVAERVSQEAYTIQGWMNHTESLDDIHHHHHHQVPEPGQIRRRLSFDDDDDRDPLSQKKKRPSVENRSQSCCIPFGKRLGAGAVDAGSGSRIIPGMDVEDGGLNISREAGRAGKTGSERRTGHATSDSEENSFLANVDRLSRNRATSTPRRAAESGRPPPPPPSSSSSSLLSSAMDRDVGRDAMVPEREAVSCNLRSLKRPASAGAIHFRSSSSSSASLQLWTHGELSGADTVDLMMSQLGNARRVQLLQRLYTADDATRHAIILKAQLFKSWQSTARTLKQQRLVYSASLKRAHRFLTGRLQRRSFFHWRGAAAERRKRRMAEGVHRLHMLRKGLQGFRWARLRSRHQIRTLQMRVSAIATRAAFDKWLAQFQSRREERMRAAFRRWREFAYEEKIIRERQKDQNEKMVCVTMLLWREAYGQRIKENIADKYLRRTSLRQCWRGWSHFTRWAMERASRHSLALDLRRRNLRRTTMHAWQVALCQSRKASQHFRKCRLRRIVQAWRQGAEISRAERQRDMAESHEHWRRTAARRTFLTWHHRLHLCRAVAMADSTLSRTTFALWREAWQSNSQRRQRVEAAITHSRLRKSLLTWRRHVLDRRRKQKQAVYLLETCLTRVAITAWRGYTAHKTGFRASLQRQVTVTQCRELSRCFCLWRDALHVRLDARHRQQLWSLACVRKMTAHWRHKCHIRRLLVTLEETQPIRDLALLRRMFGQWIAAKSRADGENREVTSSQRLLARCSLQRRFQQWRLVTQRALTIRPLVLRQQRQLATWCFDAWRRFIMSRLERHQREKLFQKNQLARAFAQWRRQYRCQQVSLQSQQGLTRGVAHRLLQGWRSVLLRKHQARRVRSARLLQRCFGLWQGRTRARLREKGEQRAEQELSQMLRQRYLSQWRSGVQAQMSSDNEAVASLQQRHHHNHIHSAFFAWRRSLHAHVISRAYQRTTTLRLQRSVLLEWQEAASHSLRSAVQHFAQQLGLRLPEGEGEEEGGGVTGEEGGELVNSLNFRDLLQLSDTDQLASVCASPTASLKQLFASDQSTSSSERLLGSDLDLDRAALLSSGLQETMEERRQKDLRLQALSMMFLGRLRHWPVGLAFSQWRDHTQRQRHLRRLLQEVGEKHRATTAALTFRRWSLHLENSRKATSLRNWKLQHGSLTALVEYGRHRKVKAVLAERARGHLVRNVLGTILPWWLAKAQEQRHQRSVLHLWSTATPEEAELLPLEAGLSGRIRHRTLRSCMQVWRVRFLFLVRVKRVFHLELLGRVMCTWQDWASLRQYQRKMGESFLRARRTNLAFRTWCERVRQKRETERRYQAALEAYLRLVFRCWSHWARVSRQQRQSLALVEVRGSRLCVRTHFVTWRRLAQHAMTIRAARHTHLLHSVLLGWRQATVEGRQLQQAILQFQTRSLTGLVGQLFHTWQTRHHRRQRLQLQREERAQQSALRCGRHWRKVAQGTRGRKLGEAFRHSRLCRSFQHWQASLVRVDGLKERLGALAGRKDRATLRQFLHEWRQRLQAAILLRSFTLRLLATMLRAWQVFAKGSKERRIRALALQHALQERNLRVYFLYWRQMSLRVRSLQNNVEMRLQLRVLQAWSYVTRRCCSQRRLGEKFARLRQGRTLTAAFYTLRTRLDYCQGLREMAAHMCARRDRVLARRAVQRWKDGVDNRTAQRFYRRLLCVRTARTWLTFVMRVQAERRQEFEQTCRAVEHHNKTLCHVVLEAMKQEVKVKRQLQRRRQRIVCKFATSWKHITDLSVTAVIVEEERLYAHYWRRWRLVFVRCQAANRDVLLHRRQLLSQVFTSWHSLCPSRRVIDVPNAVPHRRTTLTAGESGRDSPTLLPRPPRSFLPVPVTSSRRSAADS